MISTTCSPSSTATPRAGELTRQLLTFSRKQAMQPQVVDLNEVVNNVSKMLRRILGEDIALEVWREHAKEIDLVVTDLVLPNGMAGRELAQALQASRSGLKIIYTSGYDTENMVQDAAVGAGPNFIQKPFHARKLAEVVYDCLNEK